MKRKSMWLLFGMVGLCLAVLVACKPQAPPPQCFEHKIDLTGLTYALCADKGRYRYGEAIRASFTLTNTGNRKVTLNGGDKPALELQLAGGTWTNISPAPATQITLEAGAAYTIAGRWIPEQAYLEESTAVGRGHRAFMTIYAAIRLKPDDVRSARLSVEYLPDEPAPIPTENKLSGNCAGEQRSAGDLELQICTDKLEYQFGETVQVRWQIRNISDSPIVLDGGDAAAMDIHIVEWDLPAGEKYPIASGEERQSDTNDYETRIELAPGAVYLIEWQWPTEQTNFDAVLEYMRPPEKREIAFVYINGDYCLRPGNRWSFDVRINYAVEDNR
ncbi:MAG TPA: hypothetical protein PLH19_13595 [Anaerolineae bacterium]|nr:hypothetical protein [Anaerolineae bacterium]HQH39553.1 hypothetical protein [Anaerolineae bacterium]